MTDGSGTMDKIFSSFSTLLNPSQAELTAGISFWQDAVHAGWLEKQGDVIKTWRKRWFVLKDNKLFWFLDDDVQQCSRVRGVIDVSKCMSVKGCDDALGREHCFELSTRNEQMYFVCATKADKEGWLSCLGKAVVSTSRDTDGFTEYLGY